MRKMISIVLILLFLLLGAACQSEEPQKPGESQSPAKQPRFSQGEESPQAETPEEPSQTEKTTETEEAPTLPEIEIDPSLGLVSDLSRGTYINEYGAEYSHALPQINIPGEDIAAVNRKIRSDLNYDETIANYGEYRSAGTVSYFWHQNGDLLTVIISSIYDVRPTYRVYNVNIPEAREALPAEVLAAAAVSEEDFYAHGERLLCNVLFEHMDSFSDGCDYYFGNLEEDDSFLYLFTDTQAFMQQAVPYLNEDGELYFFARIAVPAGGGMMDCLIPYTTEYTVSPYYDLCLDALA